MIQICFESLVYEIVYEIEDSWVKFLIAYKSGQYDVVGERSIFINEDDHETGTVYDKSKPFEVAILAKGKINLLSW